MTALVIIGIIIGLIVFIGIGYYLWSVSFEKYDYNIFSLGVIIRGLGSLGCVLLSFNMYDGGDSLSAQVFILVAILLWIWTFVYTWIKCNFFIAFFLIIYQVFAVFLIKSAINRILR